MAISDIISRFQEKRKVDREVFKQKQREDRLDTMVQERKKSANERELEKRLRIKREDRIKAQLDRLRDEDKRNARHNIFKQKNIFTGHKSILAGKSQFTVKSNMLGKGGFFK